jgi:RNA polymerase sigma-70 factor (ECF subfamily)
VEPELRLEGLYRRHRRAVYGLALRDLRDPDEAEDITQVTFLNAYRALRRGDTPESPRAWLLAIARNVCRRRYRARALRPLEVELDSDLALAPEDEGPSAGDILAALERLAPNHRAAVLLREFWGLSYAEIAKELGLSHSAVEALLFRARGRLREELEVDDIAPRRSMGGLLVFPLPAALLNALDSAVTAVSRNGAALRAASVLAAGVLGAGVALEWGSPSASGKGPAEAAAAEPSPAASESAPLARERVALLARPRGAAGKEEAAQGEKADQLAQAGGALRLDGSALDEAAGSLPTALEQPATPSLDVGEVDVPVTELPTDPVEALPPVTLPTATLPTATLPTLP